VQTSKGQEGDLFRTPDLTIWFELDPAVAAARLVGVRVPDKFEAQPVEFFRRVSDGYLQRLNDDPQRFTRIKADQARALVWRDVLQAVQTKRWLP
jgi:dTMP kinase